MGCIIDGSEFSEPPLKLHSSALVLLCKAKSCTILCLPNKYLPRCLSFWSAATVGVFMLLESSLQLNLKSNRPYTR